MTPKNAKTERNRDMDEELKAAVDRAATKAATLSSKDRKAAALREIATMKADHIESIAELTVEAITNGIEAIAWTGDITDQERAMLEIEAKRMAGEVILGLAMTIDQKRARASPAGGFRQ